VEFHAKDLGRKLRKSISCFYFLSEVEQQECSFFDQLLLFDEVWIYIYSLSLTVSSLPSIVDLVF